MTEPSTIGGRRVLIVEDEPRLRDMLVRAIRDMEFTVTAAPTAEVAIDLLAGEVVDIVLSDLNLPGMHGLEFCEHVRRTWPEIQLLILTGYGDLEVAKKAIRLDVVDFLTKPCPLGELEAALDRALRRRRHHIIAHGLDDDRTDEGAEIDAAAPATSAEPRRLEDLERDHILDALARHDGNRELTAEELGISVRTLYYRLKQYEQQGFYRRADPA